MKITVEILRQHNYYDLVDRVLAAKNIGNLYHFTTLLNLIQILDDNVLKGGRKYSEWKPIKNLSYPSLETRTFGRQIVLR